MRIYIIRHGETDWNKERKIQGVSDIPLNNFGRKLAEQTKNGLKTVTFDAAYTSPLKRAKETAQIILGGRDVPLYEDARIQEMEFGIYEGMCCKGEHYNIPDPEFRKFFEEPAGYCPPKGGESFAQVRKRTGEFLLELFEKEAYQESTILVATHGAALAGMLNYMKGLPIERYWDGGVRKNCEVVIVDVTKGVPSIVNDGIIYYHEETEAW